MRPGPQTFANHARYVPLYHFILYALIAGCLVRAVNVMRDTPSIDAMFQVVLALALGMAAWYARAFALTVQDRVIRLEMGLRMQRVTPHLLPDFGRFTPAQLAALRFAGDGELADLAQRVLDGTLAKPADIKRAVRDWQPDHLRV